MERPCHQLPPHSSPPPEGASQAAWHWRGSKRGSPSWRGASTSRCALRVRGNRGGHSRRCRRSSRCAGALGGERVYARALAIGAGVVQVALGSRWASLRVQRRDLCLELVIAGREHLPLAAVARERQRLDDPRRQAQLATSLEHLAVIAVRTAPARAPASDLQPACAGSGRASAGGCRGPAARRRRGPTRRRVARTPSHVDFAALRRASLPAA